MRLKSLFKPILSVSRIMAKPFGYVVVQENSRVDFFLHEYASYEEYKEVQIFHNKRKISNVWADDRTMTRVGEIVTAHAGKEKIKGICHGTRNGYEQNFLNSNFSKIEAFGTDISDTATDYPNSIQWDFHDENEEWLKAFDFVYTNSLDQSWKPRLALTKWLNQVRKGGCVIIEHTRDHGPMGASKMDPFGVRPIAMPYVLSDWFGDQISISHTKAKKSNNNRDAWLFVCRKLVDRVE